MLKDKRQLSFQVPAADYMLLKREAARRKITLQVLLTEIAQPAIAELRQGGNLNRSASERAEAVST